MKYKIRKMTARDYDAVVALWRGMPGIGLDEDSDSRVGITRYLERNPGLSFVAEIQDKIVGAVLSGHDGRRGYLHHLAVATSHRKLGIGKALTSCCLRSLRKQGIPKCNIFLLRSNYRGRSFSKHNGWNVQRRLERAPEKDKGFLTSRWTLPATEDRCLSKDLVFRRVAIRRIA